MSGAPVANGGAKFIGWVIAGLGAIGGLIATLVLIINLWTGPINEKVSSNRAEANEKISEIKQELARISQLAAERGHIIPQIRADVEKNKGDVSQIQREIIAFKERIEAARQSLEKLEIAVEKSVDRRTNTNRR